MHCQLSLPGGLSWTLVLEQGHGPAILERLCCLMDSLNRFLGAFLDCVMAGQLDGAYFSWRRSKARWYHCN